MPRDPLIGLVGKVRRFLYPLITPLTADARGIQPSSGKSTTLNSLTDATSKVGEFAKIK